MASSCSSDSPPACWEPVRWGGCLTACTGAPDRSRSEEEGPFLPPGRRRELEPDECGKAPSSAAACEYGSFGSCGGTTVARGRAAPFESD